MSKEHQRLKYLRDEVIGIAMKINLIEMDLVKVGKDVAFLEGLISSLEKNIETLKDKEIVAVASEFKKIKQELKTANKNLKFYQGLKGQLLREQAKYERMKVSTEAEHDALKIELEHINTVIKFDPSKRKK